MGVSVANGNGESFLLLLNAKLGSHILESGVSLGDPHIRIDRNRVLDIMRILKLDSELSFDLFLNVTAVDWMDSATERFEVVYHLLSLKTLRRLRVKVWVPEGICEIHSVSELWPGADFQEREVYDMYGIRFTGHPDLRRILMYDEFQGYPLRKDYPVQGKQPRVTMRYPEVRNTAMDMKRGPLVAINKRRAVTAGGSA